MSCPRSGARIEAEVVPAPADLADIVECFWVGRWDLRGQTPHVSEMIGAPSVHIVAEAGRCRLVGVWTGRWVRPLVGLGMVRAAKLRPGAVRALLEEPAIALTDGLHQLDAKLATPADFERRLLAPYDDEEAFDALAAWLRARRRPEPAGMRRAMAVCAALESPTAGANVRALAQSHGLEVRTLQRLFRDHVGASPKLLLRRARLRRGIERMRQGDFPNLAALAFELGYADQAQFSRDVRTQLGRSARQLARSLAAAPGS